MNELLGQFELPGLRGVSAWGVVAAVAVPASLGTWAARRLALRREVIARPEARSSHEVPTPTGGGLGPVIAVVLGLVLFASNAAGELTAPTLALALAVLIALGTGWVDDVRSLRPRKKMTLLVVAALLVACVVRADGLTVPVPGGDPVALPFGMLALPLSAVYVAAYSNAFNFMDGINGIAGLTAIVTGAALAWFGVQAGDALLAAIGLFTAAACAGYLPWNFPAARVFMGDAGSLPLGVLLAAGVLRADQTGALDVLPGTALLTPYVFDTGLTLIRRARRGERLSEAHREHLYQRFARLVDSHVPSALLYAAFAAGCAVVMAGYESRSGLGQIVSLLSALAPMLAFAALITVLERRRSGD